MKNKRDLWRKISKINYGEFPGLCIVVSVLIVILLAIYTNSSNEEEKNSIGGPTNFLGVDQDETFVMIIDYNGTTQTKEYFSVIHHFKLEFLPESFPIFEPKKIYDNFYFITVTESIKNSELIQNKNYRVNEDDNRLDIVEYPDFLKTVEEFILTIQYPMDHKPIGAIYRNLWRIHIKKESGAKNLDRFSLILPKNAYIWNSNKTIWISTKIEELEGINVDLEDRIGISWYLEEEEIDQCLEIGFGTPIERIHWENKELATQQFIITLAALFLAITVPIRSIKSVRFLIYPEKRNLILNCGLVSFVVLIICYLIFYIKILEFPIKTDLHYWTGGTLFILVLIHFGLKKFYEEYIR